MNELPVLLEEAVERRALVAAGGPEQGPAVRGWIGLGPLWMAPARLIGYLRPTLRAAAAADAAAFRRFPSQLRDMGMPLIVVLVALAFVASHATHHLQYSQVGTDWTRVIIAHTFTESPAFLIMAIAIGVFSAPLGVLFVIVYAVLDLVVAAGQPPELIPLPGALFGRLISYWLLWLLVVEIPAFARMLAVSWRAAATNRLAVALLAGLGTGAFTWFWTQTATVLIRPVFVWSDLRVAGAGMIAAVTPIQQDGIVFAAVAAAAAVLVGLTRDRDAFFDLRSMAGSPGDGNGAIAVGRRLLGAAVLTVALGGMVTSLLEAAVVFASLAGSGPLARFVANRTVVGTLVRLLPPMLRYALAAALTLAVSYAFVTPMYAGVRLSIADTFRFIPLVLAFAVGYFFIELVTTPRAAAEARPRTLFSGMTVMLVMGAAAVGLSLLAPLIALADNCSGLSDCWSTPALACFAGAAVPMAMAAAACYPSPEMDRNHKDNQDRRKYLEQKRRDQDRPDRQGFPNNPRLQAAHNKYLEKQIKYWASDPPRYPPMTDDKPSRLGAVASSAAAGRT